MSTGSRNRFSTLYLLTCIVNKKLDHFEFSTNVDDSWASFLTNQQLLLLVEEVHALASFFDFCGFSVSNAFSLSIRSG